MSKISLSEKVLEAAQEYADSIAFYDKDRGYVAYSVEHTIELRQKLADAAYEYGKYKEAADEVVHSPIWYEYE